MIFRRDVKNKIAKKILENVPKNHFLPYPYQLDLLDSAYEHNTIMCISNEFVKNFVVVHLVREMHHDYREKNHVIYFTQDKHLRETVKYLGRHVNLNVIGYECTKSHKEWDFQTWSCKLMHSDISVVSPWLLPSIIQNTSVECVRDFIYKNFYLIIVSECHHLSNPRHPYYLLFGPRGVLSFKPSEPQNHDCPRLVCFTSALLPAGITDPVEAEHRLIELERLTNSKIETASELLTMLSLGARPKERIMIMPSCDDRTDAGMFHDFVAHVFRETNEFLNDVCLADRLIEEQSGFRSTQAPDSRGRMICVLDYCRRAVAQCQQSLRELGVWCSAQVTRVFVKHLVGLDFRRRRLIRDLGSHRDPEDCEDRLARVLRFTITQFCLVVRLFQTEFDTCMTYDTFKTMISPRMLSLIELLKTYKPCTDFRIEVAEKSNRYPNRLYLGRKVKKRRGRHLSQSSGEEICPLILNMNLLSDGYSDSSNTSNDTMTSASDQEAEDSNSVFLNSSTNAKSSPRTPSSSVKLLKTKRKININHNTSNSQDSGFQPISSVIRNGRLPLDVDPFNMVYRAVSASNPDGTTSMVEQKRMCGLILVPCQFTAYALARLIDEAAIWDDTLFFVKPAHLFASQSSLEKSPYEKAKLHGASRAPHSLSIKTGVDSMSVNAQWTLPVSQEETISKFRRGSVNLLVATQAAVSAAAGGTELPRCNLVVSLQTPQSLAEYLSSKARTRLVDHGAQVVYLLEENPPNTVDKSAVKPDGDAENESVAYGQLDRFQRLEHLLVQRCRGYHLFADEHDVSLDKSDQIFPPFCPAGGSVQKLPFSRSINVVNQYCAQLPTDYITKLTPRWRMKRIRPAPCWNAPSSGPGASCGAPGEEENARQFGLYVCMLRLPINSSIKKEISGHPMACKKLAKLSAAFNAIQELYKAGELDSRWELVTKEPGLSNLLTPRDLIRKSTSLTNIELSDCQLEISASSVPHKPVKLMPDTRRRQYYFKKFADQMRDCLPQPGDPSPNYLYFIQMHLTHPLLNCQTAAHDPPPCFRPEDEPLGFGLLTTKPLRHIPAFPIFTRSGEETVRLLEVWSPFGNKDAHIPLQSPALTSDQIDQAIRFHRVVFQAVLRLERDAIVEFQPEKAYSQVLVVPVMRDTWELDWDFVSRVLSSCSSGKVCRLLPRRHLTDQPAPPVIVKPSGRTRGSLKSRACLSLKSTGSIVHSGTFEFREEDFRNAVVMPLYRNLDQPQHYYVTKIRFEMNPLSPFPSSAFANFATYYAEKYEATITTVEQPLIEVDFTAMRLNLLVPRHLNIHGQYLSSCFGETRKHNRRELVHHKQILIPELCFRHPFPASVWRKTVCIPSILYRLQSLLLADELRFRIARDTKLGRADPLSQGSSGDEQDLFEPLRLVFPLQVQRAVEECSAPLQPENWPLRRRKRAGRGANKNRKENDRSASFEKQTAGSTTPGKSMPMEEEDEEDEDDAVTEEVDGAPQPKIVRLRAATAPGAAPGPLSSIFQPPHPPRLEAMLEETKVIEFDQNVRTDPNTADEDVLLPVENRFNMDTEYPETGSDVESVDSFEENVRFFPSEDDCEFDEQFDRVSIPTHQSATSKQRHRVPRPHRPGPANILQALTMSCSNDFINLERMETIGDSFLKFVVTTQLYLLYPNAHEGKLSHMRSRIVCNSHLYRLGLSKNLPDRMVATKFSPGENWIPPGYVVREDYRVHPNPSNEAETNGNQSPSDLNVWSVDKSMDEEVFRTTKVHDPSIVEPIKALKISRWNPRDPEIVRAQQLVEHSVTSIQQALPDKSIADCVEALIGCYLTTRGERSALRLLRWFGIDCLPDRETLIRPKGAPWFPPPPNVSPNDDVKLAALSDARLAWHFDQLEAQLQYTFRDPSLLIQAFTHPSYHQLRRGPCDDDSCSFLTDTDCYQRLEFLGDAVLDYVITRFLFEDSEQHSPGVLTDLRSALVNNNIFAALAVKLGLHRYLRASSPQLLYAIDQFVKYQKEVAKDDLDFITNEEIEVRFTEQEEPVREEQTPVLVSSNPLESDGVQTDSEISGHSDPANRGAFDDDEEEEAEEAALNAPDAPTFETDKSNEADFQKHHTRQLTSSFLNPSVDNSGDIVEPSDNPTRDDCDGLTMNTDDVEIPKALGDVFESLAGAIFLDSDLCLDTVWAVFYPLMKERIERYTACIPKSPVRQLLELEPEGTKFERPRRTADGRISVCAHVLGKGRFYGVGRNYRLAKSLAAKRAIRVLKRLQVAQAASSQS